MFQLITIRIDFPWIPIDKNRLARIPSMRIDFPSMGNPLSLKSITNVFKIDLKSILMDSHRWNIDGDPWNLNPGKKLSVGKFSKIQAKLISIFFLTLAIIDSATNYPATINLAIINIMPTKTHFQCPRSPWRGRVLLAAPTWAWGGRVSHPRA